MMLSVDVSSLWSLLWSPFCSLPGAAWTNVMLAFTWTLSLIKEHVPEELQPTVKMMVMGIFGSIVAGIPSSLIYSAYRVYQFWDTLRYFAVVVEQHSAVYQWIEFYLSENKENTGDQVYMKLRLATEPTSHSSAGRGRAIQKKQKLNEADKYKLTFDMVEGQSSPDLSVADTSGKTKKIRVSKLLKEGKGKDVPPIDAFMIQVQKCEVWRFWKWRDTTYARDLIAKFVEDCRKKYDAANNNMLEIWTVESHYGWHGWCRLDSRVRRSFDTLHLPAGLKEDIVSDCEQFLNGREMYERIGIPYRKGYLLYGAPGCGKSSFIFALASHFNIPICMLDLTQGNKGGPGGGGISDSGLQILINSAPPTSILVIEEVDTLFLSKEEVKEKQVEKKKAEMRDAANDDDGPSPPPRRGGPPPPPPPAPPPNMSAGQFGSYKRLLSDCVSELANDEKDDDATAASSQLRVRSVAKLIKAHVTSLGSAAAAKLTEEEDKEDESAAKNGKAKGGGGASPKARGKTKGKTPDKKDAEESAAAAAAPAISPPPDPPLLTTMEWLDFTTLLKGFGFDDQTIHFSQPLLELQELQKVLGTASVSLAISVEKSRDLRSAFADVDVEKLHRQLSELNERIGDTCKKVLPQEPPPPAAEHKPYLSKAEFRESAQNCICSFAGLLQALDGITAQEGRLVFFTTNHREKLDEALIRPGRMDRHIEFNPAGPHEIREQFVRIFGKLGVAVPKGKATKAPTAKELETQADRLQAIVKEAKVNSPDFKMPTLAMTQVYFQTKFREEDPMTAAIDGFKEFFKIDEGKAKKGGEAAKDSVDFPALTRQFSQSQSLSRGGSSSGK